LKSRHIKHDIIHHSVADLSSFRRSLNEQIDVRYFTTKSCGQILRPRTAKTRTTSHDCHVAFIFIKFIVEIMKSDRGVPFARRRTLCTVQMYTRVHLRDILYISILVAYMQRRQKCKYLVHKDIEKKRDFIREMPEVKPLRLL